LYEIIYYVVILIVETPVPGTNNNNLAFCPKQVGVG
jgi:hypothetical protein